MNDTPKAKKIKKGDPRHVRVHQLWMILVCFVMARSAKNVAVRGAKDPRKLVYYGDLGEDMGYDRRAGHTLGAHLGTIAKFCIDNDLPPLNAIVINQQTGRPGAEVMLADGQIVEEAQEAVLEFDWFSIRVPSPNVFRRVWDNWI